MLTQEVIERIEDEMINDYHLRIIWYICTNFEFLGNQFGDDTYNLLSENRGFLEDSSWVNKLFFTLPNYKNIDELIDFLIKNKMDLQKLRKLLVLSCYSLNMEADDVICMNSCILKIDKLIIANMETVV